ncbi:MAG: hypothetical protein IT460_01335 [Planctomycetes bacterium]|nr:hypothetical protein [Planctomycetota bacterium]
MTTETTDADRRDVRNAKIAFWLGIALGLSHGVKRYGLFRMETVAMMGLMVIVCVSLYAAIVALGPSRDA